MRTPKEKKQIVKRFLNGESAIKLAKKYKTNGIDGLKSQTGKASKHHKNMGLNYCVNICL